MQNCKLIILILIGLLWTFDGQAQIKDLLKKKAEEKAQREKDKAAQKAKEGVKNAADNQLDKIRGEQDTTGFGYSIAVFDNSGSYDDGNKAKDIARLGIGATDVLGVTRDNNRDPLQGAKNSNSFGELMYASRRFKSAEKSFDRAQRLFESNGGATSLSYSQTLANKGLLFQTTGRYIEAEEFTQKALELRKQTAGDKSSAYAASLNNLAMLYRDEGKYNEAEKTINEALKVTEQVETKNSISYAIMLNNKAMLSQTVGRNEDAVSYLTEALKIAEPLLKERSNTFQRMQVNLALIYQELKKYPEAEKLYLDAIKTKEKRLKGAHPDVAQMKNYLAALYMQMNKLEEVEELLQESLKIFEKKIGKQNEGYASTLSNLGNYFRIKGDLAKATANLQEALNIRKQVLGEKHPNYNRNEEDLALAFWQVGDWDDAAALFRKVISRNNEFIREYFPPMSEAEKAKYWDKLRPSYLKFYSFATEFAAKDASLLTDLYNAHLVTKAILLSETTRIKRNILNSGNQTLINDYNTWVKQKEDLAKIYTFSKEELLEQAINVDSLERVNNDLEKKLSASVQLVEKTITFNDIAAKLAADEAALDIISFQRYEKTFSDKTYYAALVITKGATTPKMVLLDNGKELDTKFFKSYRNSIQAKKADKYSYEQYWSKIEPLLAGKPKVYTSLDGVYNQISINTIQKPDGKYLVDEKAFVFLTNMKDLLKAKPTFTNKNAFLVGFPEYGTTGSIPPLPGTKKEVDAIALQLAGKGYQAKKYMAKDASEGKLKKEVNNPRILHIATHGFFLNDVSDFGDKVFGIDVEKAQENPLLRAGLMFAGAESAAENKNTKELRSDDNGILTAFEAMNMSLDKTELVILSACETGLGDVKAGEGVYGLQRAFQVAGANTLIMSLWTVSDAATVDLMNFFYQNYLASGNKVDAFKKAQVQLKTKYKEPYFWGAFVMIGN
jgi:CHAT domain-containing protein